MKRLALFAVMILLILVACQEQPPSEAAEAAPADAEASTGNEASVEKAPSQEQEPTAVGPYSG
jgi:ABC-type enterochelin transport system substrate-binding protein